ncbi:MAG: hypothetical protein Q9165_002144 [Trypethelium subeluteriae]
MAILASVPGIEVAVTVDGNDVKEYTDPNLDEEPNVVTKYIEVSSESEFGLRYLVRRGTHFKKDAMSFNTYVDGQQATGPLISKKKTVNEDGGTTRRGGRISDTEYQKFKFVALETISAYDDSPAQNCERAKTLGTIEVTVGHVQTCGREEGSSITRQDPEILSEKALKGQSLSHRVSYGETIPRTGKTIKTQAYGPPIVRCSEGFDDHQAHIIGRQRAEKEATNKVKRERFEEGIGNDTRNQKRTCRAPSTAYLEIDDNGNFIEVPPPPSKRVNEAEEIVHVDD